jgi:hypothetical protein
VRGARNRVLDRLSLAAETAEIDGGVNLFL